MNKYEKRAEQQRNSTLRSSMNFGAAGVLLVAVIVIIIGVNTSASREFYTRAAIGLAILMLILRHLNRRLRSRAPRSAQPDPRSTLKLH